jgi:hypothetical protein
MKTSNPTMKESIRGILATWGRVVTAQEGIDILWMIVSGNGGDWEVNIEGDIKRIERYVRGSPKVQTPGVFTLFL